jgi:hypothetical protein
MVRGHVRSVGTAHVALARRDLDLLGSMGYGGTKSFLVES